MRLDWDQVPKPLLLILLHVLHFLVYGDSAPAGGSESTALLRLSWRPLLKVLAWEVQMLLEEINAWLFPEWLQGKQRTSNPQQLGTYWEK